MSPRFVRPLAAAFALLLCASALAAQDPIPETPPARCAVAEDPRIEVLLLGSYHMSNPGADQFNLESDDVLAPRRQAEIKALVDRLAAFRPTKVAVEAPWGDSATVARWNAYRDGRRELRRSEEEQIGFRLARQSGLDRIYPIDVRMGMDQAALGRVVQAEPRFGHNLQQMDSLGRWAIEMMADQLAGGTVTEMLHLMNRPEAIEMAHMPYVGFFAPIVSDTTYAGADMVAGWYRRNLRIFANLTRIATPDDRVFVVYGQGHIKLLRDFVVEHPGFCLVDPLAYLE
jgi:Family of unknown function (DUF5694)